MKCVMIVLLLFYNHICEFESVVEPSTSNTEIQQIETNNSADNKIKSETGETHEQLDPPSVPVFYPPLQVVTAKHGEGFKLLIGSKTEISSKEKVLTLCPAETSEEVESIKNFIGLRYCLFDREENNANSDTVKCKINPEPQLWEFSEQQSRCGEEDRGVKYTYVYNVCWKSKSLMLKVPILKSQNQIFPKIKQDYFEVFTVCWMYRKAPLYVRYTLVSATEEEVRSIVEPKKISTQTNGFISVDLQTSLEFYENATQDLTLKPMFGSNFKEYLIPQRLISPKHVKPVLAKDVLHNYLNVAPQWPTINKKWQQLEDHIWKLGLKNSKQIFIYAGTCGTITINEKQLVLRKDKNAYLDVPSIWWKLIIDLYNGTGIVLAMQNEPNNFKDLDKKLCETSICSLVGWNEINEIAYCCPYNKEIQERLHLNKEDIVIAGIFDPTVQKQKRSKLRSKPKKSESQFLRWLKKFKPKPLERKPKSA